MPRAKPFDKKTSTTYALVHRPQNDPLIHDADASSHVFTEIAGPLRAGNKNKVKQRVDLDEEFGAPGAVRDNEGEAAEHGIFYDDSHYDYMQHMRDLGGNTEATWVEAPKPRTKVSGKVKMKQSLEDALREASLDDDLESQGGMSLAENRTSGTKSTTQNYQSQQDIPDALAGFQPDMDPRLREVLEALDDEAYVDDEDDIFTQLAGEGAEELEQDEWEDTLFDDEDGWESDNTSKPAKEYRDEARQEIRNAQAYLPVEDAPGFPSSTIPPSSKADGDWLASFAKSKGNSPAPAASNAPLPPLSSKPLPVDMLSSSMVSSASQFGRRKKRKGALTSSTAFSMTSSVLARTEPLSTLDSRFDRIAEFYMEDADLDEDEFDDNVSLATATTAKTTASRFSSFGGSQASEAPQLMPSNFDSIIDDFLGGATAKKGKRMKKGGREGIWGQQTGMQQLDEVRQGLGPARFVGKSRTQRA